VTQAQEGNLSQKEFVLKGGVTLALYLERLPSSLGELPFTNKATITEFPHALERGIGPSGTFFDFFSAADEAIYWEYAREEFEFFGYKRFASGLPVEAPNSLDL